jgi:hypothetical protein
MSTYNYTPEIIAIGVEIVTGQNSLDFLNNPIDTAIEDIVEIEV